MPVPESYIESLKARLDEAKKYLETLETGGMRIGTRPAGGEWIDVTQDWIKREREAIATYESLIALAEARGL